MIEGFAGRPNGKVICRILGFAEEQCTSRNYQLVVLDQVIGERRTEAYKRRPGYPNDVNVFFSYKTTPRFGQEHLNFPGNFNIEDEVSVLAIFNKMNEQERRELRERVLSKGRA